MERNEYIRFFLRRGKLEPAYRLYLVPWLLEFIHRDDHLTACVVSSAGPYDRQGFFNVRVPQFRGNGNVRLVGQFEVQRGRPVPVSIRQRLPDSQEFGLALFFFSVVIPLSRIA